MLDPSNSGMFILGVFGPPLLRELDTRPWTLASLPPCMGKKTFSLRMLADGMWMDWRLRKVWVV